MPLHQHPSSSSLSTASAPTPSPRPTPIISASRIFAASSLKGPTLRASPASSLPSPIQATPRSSRASRPGVHGIASNTTFDPLFRNQVGWFWYASDEHAETLWQAAHAKGISTASLNWPITVDAPGIDFNLPEFWRARTSDDLPLLRALARPIDLQQQLEAKLGPYIDGNTLTIASDETRARFAIALLHDHHPGFFTVHLARSTKKST